MSVVDMASIRLIKEVELFCHNFNVNRSTEAGKCSYQVIHNGVELYHAHFRLDSQHCDYQNPIARIMIENHGERWSLFIPSTEHGEEMIWQPYERLSQSQDLELLLNELNQDPLSCFWKEDQLNPSI